MLGRKIAFARNKAGYSNQKEFANILKIGARTLADYETNNSEPKANTLKNIAEICNVSADWLLSSNDELTIPANVKKNRQNNILFTQNDNLNEKPDSYSLKKVTAYKASAGGGNDIEGIEVYETGEIMHIDKSFFKVPPSKNVRVIQVDGYSMIPMLLPDSWVIFDEISEFKTDGLYIINYGGQLMVKLLQIAPNGILKIISKNQDYQSYEINLKETNEFFKIVGKVIRVIM